MAAARVIPVDDTFEDFLAQEKTKDLLRFTTAGGSPARYGACLSQVARTRHCHENTIG